MENPEYLNDLSLTLVDLGTGCAVGGLLVGEVEVWFAWGPFGILPRVFASKWTAVGATVTAMLDRWREIDEGRLAILDKAKFIGLHGSSFQPIVCKDGGDASSSLWRMKLRSSERFFVDEQGRRLLASAYLPAMRGEAEAMRDSLVQLLKDAVAGPSGTGFS